MGGPLGARPRALRVSGVGGTSRAASSKGATNDAGAWGAVQRGSPSSSAVEPGTEAPGTAARGEAALASGLKPIRAAGARPLPERPGGQPETGVSTRWIPMVARASQQRSPPCGFPARQAAHTAPRAAHSRCVHSFQTEAWASRSYRKGQGGQHGQWWP